MRVEDHERRPMKELLHKLLANQTSKWHEITEIDGLPAYHASSVWTCFRKAYYRARDETPDKEPPYGLFEMGHKAEDAIEAALIEEEGERFVRNNLPTLHREPGYYIIGESDPVVMGWNLEPKVLYECKSSRAGHRASSKDGHLRQGAFYAVKNGFPELRIVHPSRNDLLDIPDEDTIISDSGLLQQFFDETIAYFNRLHESLGKGEVPPANPMEDGECNYCDFRERCIRQGGWVQVRAGNNRVVMRRENDVRENDTVLNDGDGEPKE